MVVLREALCSVLPGLLVLIQCQQASAKVTNVNLCHQKMMVRKDIHLSHNTTLLDLGRNDLLQCQCDFYTPPYRGCITMKAWSIDTHSQLERCKLSGTNSQNNDTKASCVLQYRVNEVYDNCTHNLSIILIFVRSAQRPVKEWLGIRATDNSGILIECNWSSTAAKGPYSSHSAEITSTTDRSPLTTEDMKEEENTSMESNVTCINCTTPFIGRSGPRVRASEVADQVESIIATAAGFIGASLVICCICLWINFIPKGTKRGSAVQNIPNRIQSDATTCTSGSGKHRTDTVHYNAGYIETCTAELKKCSKTSNGKPISSTSNCKPISSTSNGMPISKTSNCKPISKTSNGKPISSTSNCKPISSTSNGKPISSTPNCKPISSTPNGMPISNTSEAEHSAKCVSIARLSSDEYTL